MAGFGSSLAEILAAKAGKSAPEIEEALARNASTAEGKIAQGAESSIDDLIPKESGYTQATGLPDPMKDLTSVSPPSDISPEDFNKFNVGKASDELSLSNNKGKVAAVLGGGALATAAMSGGSPQSAAPVMGPPAPAQEAPAPAPKEEVDPEAAKQESSYKRLMALMAPRKPDIMEMPDGGTSLGSDADLKAAMAKRDQNQNFLDIAKGAQLIGSSMSRTDYGKTGGNLLDEQGKLVDQPVKDLQARVENQENDPTSTASTAMRAMALKMGFKFGDKVSAADIKKQVPQMASIQNAKEHYETLRQNMAIKQLEHADSSSMKQKEHDQTAMIKLNDKMNSPESGSSRAAIGKAALISSAADRIKTLIASEKDPNNLTGRQAFEIAKSLDAMLSQGGTTISGTEHLMPKTMMTEIAKGGEYLLNKPVGAKLGAFIKQMEHLVDREKAVSQKQIATYKDRLVAGLPADFRKRNQSDIDSLVATHAQAAMTPGGADLTQTGAPAMSAQDQQAVAWAKSNPSDPRAAKILQMHGLN